MAAAEYMALVGRSNEAARLLKAHKLREAEALLRDVLARQPGAGFDGLSVALTRHELGSVLRQLGELDEARELLGEALQVRERADDAAGIGIALRDSNLTREELAKVHEARGDCAKAQEVREPSKRVCGNESCEALDYKTLQGCGRCKSVFYCGKTCQGQDWKNRHRPLCQPLKPKAKTPK